MTDLKFEDCLTRLEQIVSALEAGNLPLEESLKVFEEGVGAGPALRAVPRRGRAAHRDAREGRERVRTATRPLRFEARTRREHGMRAEARARSRVVSFDLKAYLDARQALVDAALDRVLPPETTAPATRAPGHALQRAGAGGKRLRPMLVIAGAEAVGGAAPTPCSTPRARSS